LAEAMMGFFFIFATASIPALRLTQSPMLWIPKALTPGVKRPGHECNHSPPSGVEVENGWGYCLIKQEIRLHGVLLKYRDFTFKTNKPELCKSFNFNTNNIVLVNKVID